MQKIKRCLALFMAVVMLSLTIPMTSNVEAATIKLSSKKITLIKGQSKTLKLKGTKKKAKWSSSKKSIATVTSKGKVTAKKKGTAKITAKLGKKKYTCTVKVETPKISKTKATINAGSTLQLKLSGTTQKVTWKSSKKSVATVDSKGVVTGVKAGNATITATVLKKKYTCKVTVKGTAVQQPEETIIAVNSVVLNKASLELVEGDSENLAVSIIPVNATDQNVVWTSSNTTIVTVDTNGKVTAIKEGFAVITAKVSDKIAFCYVTVKKKEIKISSISLDSTEKKLYKDQTVNLSVKILPEYVTEQTNFVWSSSDENVATVKNGTVSAIGVGECNILVQHGALNAQCKIIVEKNKEILKEEAKLAYETKVNELNRSIDEQIDSCEEKILGYKIEGYFTGTQAQYNSQLSSLNQTIMSLESQIAVLPSGAQKVSLQNQLKSYETQRDTLMNEHRNTMLIESMEDLIDIYENNRTTSLTEYYNEYQQELERIDNLY